LLTSPTGFLLVARSNHTTGSRNIKPKVVFKVQKMARKCALFCLIMGLFKGGTACFCQIIVRSAAVACTETPSHSRGPGNIRVRVWVSFTTGAVRSAIQATAGLLVNFDIRAIWRSDLNVRSPYTLTTL